MIYILQVSTVGTGIFLFSKLLLYISQISGSHLIADLFSTNIVALNWSSSVVKNWVVCCCIQKLSRGSFQVSSSSNSEFCAIPLSFKSPFTLFNPSIWRIVVVVFELQVQSFDIATLYYARPTRLAEWSKFQTFLLHPRAVHSCDVLDSNFFDINLPLKLILSRSVLLQWVRLNSKHATMRRCHVTWRIVPNNWAQKNVQNSTINGVETRAKLPSLAGALRATRVLPPVYIRTKNASSQFTIKS